MVTSFWFLLPLVTKSKVYPADGRWQIEWDVPWERLNHSEAIHRGVCALAKFANHKCDGMIRATGDGREVALMPPVSFNHHASFLHELPGNGGLGLVWFAGSRIEQCFNCSVYFSRLPVASNQWRMPKLISRRYDWGAENPNLFTDPTTGYLYAHHASSPASNCVGDPTGMRKGCCGKRAHSQKQTHKS